MENKKILSFPLGIIAVILGVAIFKNFDFETFRFEKLPLTIVYMIAFAMAIYFLFKKPKGE